MIVVSFSCPAHVGCSVAIEFCPLEDLANPLGMPVIYAPFIPSHVDLSGYQFHDEVHETAVTTPAGATELPLPEPAPVLEEAVEELVYEEPKAPVKKHWWSRGNH